jgi:predicted Zn-ribbon and HTH transcriptional regulator
MTYVCAQLISSLASSEDPIILVYFFCGEHINWRKDPSAHPISLIHGLPGQLLSQWPPSKISLVKGLSDKLQSDEPLELCSVFSSLISQLLNTAIVVCVIDAISYFEDKERRDAVCTLFRSLSKVVKLDEAPLFKVLLTSPLTCRHITRYVDKADIINIPAGCPSQAGYRRVAI